jgi:hypothetical protein
LVALFLFFSRLLTFNRTADHAKRVKFGGNRRFKEFLEQAQIGNEFSLTSPELYLTKAACLYIRILDERVKEDAEFIDIIDFQITKQWAKEICRVKDEVIYPSISKAS